MAVEIVLMNTMRLIDGEKMNKGNQVIKATLLTVALSSGVAAAERSYVLSSSGLGVSIDTEKTAQDFRVVSDVNKPELIDKDKWKGDKPDKDVKDLILTDSAPIKSDNGVKNPILTNSDPIKLDEREVFELLLPGSEEKDIADKLIANATLPEKIIVENSYIVTFKEAKAGESNIVASADVNGIKGGNTKVPFGQHSSGQDKQELADSINLKGEIVSIFDTSNAIHIKAGDKEALRLALDKRVLSVEQDIRARISSTQNNPQWGLDRLDEQTATTDNTYHYSSTGAGRTVYVLDSGLNTTLPGVIAEFGNRASVIWDVNGVGGGDCNGHGSKVSSAIAGNNFGVAKGATILMAKVTDGCSDYANLSATIVALNWLAANASAGSIVNWSYELSYEQDDCSTGVSSSKLEQAVRNVHDAGIIVVVSAGNDGCNTGNFSPTNIPEAFVVGATNNLGFSVNDRKTLFSRTGANISAFAPGENLALMDSSGGATSGNGTSFSSAYIAGTFAVACEAAGTLCDGGNTAYLYSALKLYGGTIGTVTDTDGTPLTGATSRFISMQW